MINIDPYIQRLEWLKEWIALKINDRCQIGKVFQDFDGNRPMPPDQLTFWEIGSFEHYRKFKYYNS